MAAAKRRLVVESSDDDESSHGEYSFARINKRIKKSPHEFIQVEEEQEDEEHHEEEDEEPEEGDRKPNSEQGKAANAPSFAGGESKRSATRRRVWNEDDEIKVLKGIIDFQSAQGISADDNMCGFYEYIKQWVQIDFSRKQLRSKIRRLKNKYLTNKAKEEGGEELFLFKPHELRLFELSEKIWGSQNNNDDEGEEDEDEPSNAEVEDFGSKYPCLNESVKLEELCGYTLPDFGINFVKERLRCIGNCKAKELEEKWRNLQVEETKVKLMRARLIQEQIQLILDTISW